jgi:hypothetical protein
MEGRVWPRGIWASKTRPGLRAGSARSASWRRYDSGKIEQGCEVHRSDASHLPHRHTAVSHTRVSYREAAIVVHIKAHRIVNNVVNMALLFRRFGLQLGERTGQTVGDFQVLPVQFAYGLYVVPSARTERGFSLYHSHHETQTLKILGAGSRCLVPAFDGTDREQIDRVLFASICR